MKCPKCGQPLENADIVCTEWAERTYYDSCVGECSKCGKKYEWTELFKFDHAEDLHELN